MAPRPQDDDYRVTLIQLAKEIATAGTGSPTVSSSHRRQFLELFRAAYLHLAATVVSGGAVLQLNPSKASLAETEKLLEAFDKTT